MRSLRAVLLRLMNIAHRERWEKDLDAELQSNLELHIEDNVRAGMSREEARRAAILRFGNLPAAKEAYRRRKTIPSLGDLANDVRQSTRSLRQSKAFTFAVVATMALCIGVNAIAFSSLYGLVLKPLPVHDPDRLVRVFNVKPNAERGKMLGYSSWAQYRDFEAHADLFEGFALSLALPRMILEGNAGRNVTVQYVTADFFTLMGAQPLVGRFFLPEEVDPQAANLVVLTQTVWETDYDSDPTIVGQTLRFDNEVAHTVVGVAPRSLEAFDFEARYFVPYRVRQQARDPRNRYGDGSNLWARLKEGVSREAAKNQLQALEHRWYEEVADAGGRAYFDQMVESLEFDLSHPLESSLSLVEAGALLVLLVGCLNAMNLLAARAGQRRHELSVRSALGAGRHALRRLMLVESALLALAALGGGCLLVWGGLQVINRYLSVLDPTAVPLALDGAVLAWISIIFASVVLILGLLPLEWLRRTGQLERLDSSERSSSRGVSSRRLGNGLIIGQVAFTFVLLVGASLLLGSFRRVMAVDPGFDASRTIRASVAYQNIRLYERLDRLVLRQRLAATLREIPGVQHVALSLSPVVTAYENEAERLVTLAGEPPDPSRLVQFCDVSREYFQTMGIPMLEGAGFDLEDPQQSVVVDELFARRFLKGRSPVGTELYLTGNGQPPSPGQPRLRIVGVAKRANLRGLEERDGAPIVYGHLDPNWGFAGFTVLVRTTRPAEKVIADVRAKVHEIDPRLPLTGVTSLEGALDEILLGRRGVTLVLGLFAGLALLLSGVGIYGVLAFDVQQRQREFGIRSALGARPRELLALVMRRGIGKASVGLGLGFLASLYVNRFLEGHLFDVSVLDPRTYASAVLLLLVAAMLASYWPSRRAVRADPMVTLRPE